ncbi:Longitudinals lacking protein-like [Portunus trituberculatus]|uniref:Longitudinals lacking protein-like n=1 Tax=Portunus trituberculatus TaxID=210409 RepID=A0A5B7IIP2_PORTR|nr:Longitudinals lacking protein-like [Portunus trituberculatus]
MNDILNISLFNSLSQENPSKHPIIILKDVPFSHLQAILEYMYAGEVNVAQADLPNFLKTAERLKVKGLAEVNQNERQDR